MSALRALILGSGFAGQGHAMALRDNGVKIVGMTSQTQTGGDAIRRGQGWEEISQDV